MKLMHNHRWIIRFIFAISCLFAFKAYAQEGAPPAQPQAPPKAWQHSLVGTVAMTQVQLKDWSQGGEEALSWTFGADGKSINDLQKTNWTTAYKFAFGQTKLGAQEIRKTDDKLDLETLLTYKLGVYVNPYVAATLKSQFAKGFEYPKDADEKQVSTTIDPVYLTQSVGVGYEPVKQKVKTRLGFALREIRTNDFNKFSDDPKTEEIEKTKVDGGLESVTEVNWQLKQNLLLTSKLEIFDAFKSFTDAVVRSDSTLAIKVSKYITVNFNTLIISDTTASTAVQIKQTLTLGLSYTFL